MKTKIVEKLDAVKSLRASDYIKRWCAQCCEYYSQGTSQPQHKCDEKTP